MIFPKTDTDLIAYPMRCYFLLITLLFISAVALASNPSDSLKQLIEHAPNKEERLGALLELGFYYQGRNHDSTDVVALKALEAAQALNDYNSEAICYNMLGMYYNNKKSEYDEARRYYGKALAIARQYELKSQLAALYNNYAITFQREYKQDSAYAYLVKAEKAYLQLAEDEQYGVWKTYYVFFELFSSQMDIDQATAYANKALAIVEKGNKRIDRGYLLFNFMHFYLTNGFYDQAGYYREKWQQYQREKKSSQELMENPAHIALFMFENSDEGEIEQQLFKAIQHFEAKENSYRAGWTYEDLGNLYYKKKDIPKAEAAFESALQYFQSCGAAFRKGSVLYQLYQLHKQSGEQQKALFYLETYKSLSDSLSGVEVQENLNELKVQYQTAQKEQALRIQQLEIDQKTQQRNLLLLSSLMFALLAGGIFFTLRQRLQANRKLALQAHHLQEQRIRQLEQEKRLSSMSAMIEGQEKERSRIANDLHDSLGGLLTAARAQLASLKISGKGERSQKATQMLEDAAVELRRISHNLMPRSLSLLGIKGALEDIALQIRQSGVHCDMEIVGIEEELPKTTSIMIYRIIQELSNNIIKHANAQNVLIQLIKHQAGLLLVVEDNGTGFELEEALKQKTLGMSSLSSRVEFLEGELEIDTAPGEGTTVIIRIPSVNEYQ
jgi:two-component system NarL family sensor kinase